MIAVVSLVALEIRSNPLSETWFLVGAYFDLLTEVSVLEREIEREREDHRKW